MGILKLDRKALFVILDGLGLNSFIVCAALFGELSLGSSEYSRIA